MILNAVQSPTQQNIPGVKVLRNNDDGKDPAQGAAPSAKGLEKADNNALGTLQVTNVSRYEELIVDQVKRLATENKELRTLSIIYRNKEIEVAKIYGDNDDVFVVNQHVGGGLFSQVLQPLENQGVLEYSFEISSEDPTALVVTKKQ